LEHQAKSIGSCLQDRLKGSIKQPIAVLIDRDIASPISFLGIAYSGNFYVPIDSSLPIHRINLILETTNPSAILLTHQHSSLLEDIDFKGTVLYSKIRSNTQSGKRDYPKSEKQLSIRILYTRFSHPARREHPKAY
jgi:non-ribosomal peptide synthetase component F